ncbi:MAG: hypothetical protein R3F62_17735 [Planctomycetota bacterium]
MDAVIVVGVLAIVIPLYALAVHLAIRIVAPHNPLNVLPDALPTLLIMVVLSGLPCLGWGGFVLLGEAHFQLERRQAVVVFCAYFLLLIPVFLAIEHLGAAPR